MRDDVRSEVDRRLKDGRREAIIHVQNEVVLGAELTGRTKIDQIQPRVGWSLDEHHLRVRLDGGLPSLRSQNIDVGECDAEAGKNLRQDLDR